MEEYLANFKNCLEKEAPYCKAECPFPFDILDFIDKIKKGSMNAAYRVYRDAVGFPHIATNLCNEPCSAVCPRCKVDSFVQINLLEKSCLAHATKKDPIDYNVPAKNKKIGIVGAGICGLACALRLATKKYEVAVYEKSGQVGGHLLEILPASLLQEDIERQFKYTSYKLNLNTEIKNLKELRDEAFDVILVATGKGGPDFGIQNQKDLSGFLWGNTVFFTSGSLLGSSSIQALADGLRIANVIEAYLKTKVIAPLPEKRRTRMLMDTGKIVYKEAVTPSLGTGFSEEEANKEALRCISCACNFCAKWCDLIRYSGKMPLRIKDEVLATILPGKSYIKATPARRLINTCNQCGLCKEVCPKAIDVDTLILEGRRSMHRQGKMPWIFHDFWLREMDFSNGPLAAITKAPPWEGREGEAADALESTTCAYAFFPGCQLGASDPELVEKAYEYLLEKQKSMGLMLRCCGVPLEWSGDEGKYKEETGEIKRQWEELGKPTLILACPTCEKKFKTYMAEIPVLSLYEVMEHWGINRMEERLVAENTDAKKPKKSLEKVFAVFDPCAARHEDDVKAAVRTLARNAGFTLKPLPENDSFARCCGYGGQPGIAAPDYVDYVKKTRIAESDDPYITYCINCRDAFAEKGKKTVHILDILFREGRSLEKLATISKRRENQINLRKRLLRKFWNEEMEESGNDYGIKLIISPELTKKLHQGRILEEDVKRVIQSCRQTGRKVYNPQNESFSGYQELGRMTYWVEYKENPEKTAYELLNAYSHGMKIELETVWKGKRQTQI